MSLCELTTVFGLIAAISGALQAVPNIDQIPYARLVLVIITTISTAALGYFAKDKDKPT